MASNRRWRWQFRYRGSRRESAVAQLFSLGGYAIMAFRLSKVLRLVCYLLAAAALFFMAVPFIDVALHQYDSPVAFVAGVFICPFALVFFLLSRCQAARLPGEHPLFAAILWVAAAVFGLAALRLLYFDSCMYL
jgi:hypothetical protein